MATHPKKKETHEMVFTTKNRDEAIAIRNNINHNQHIHDANQRGFSYLMTIIGLFNLATGVISAAAMECTGNDLEDLEDLYTTVNELLDQCSYIRVTQKLTGTWQGDDRGYVYRLEKAYFQQY
nr:hypothetical protein [uncultured Aminipila sp.]